MNKIPFKDVAHMYLGCKIQTAEGIGTFNELAVGKEAVHLPITSYDLVKAYLNFDEVKPVLRRPETLSEEEATGWASDYPQLPGYQTPMTEASLTQVSLVMMIMAREGFDLFNLIDNGEAIDAATLGKEVQP